MRAAVSRQSRHGRIRRSLGVGGQSAVSVLVAMLLCVSLPSVATAETGQRPVIVLVANYLSLDDLLNAGPNTKRLAQHSAIALVNTGPDGRSAFEGRYLAMACGFRADVPRGDISLYRSDEIVEGRPAAEVYASRTGRIAPEGSAVCLGLPRLLRANKQPAFRQRCIGLVGDAFHRAGLRTAVIGNSDTPDEPLRLAGLLAMDRNGVVDNAIPKGEPAATAASRLPGHALVVVDFGDLNCLEATRDDMTDQAYTKARAECLLELDALLGRLSRLPATLIVCSPCRSQGEGQWSNLTPVIVYQAGGRSGLLASATTRMPGLISNIDVGPTIISRANLLMPEYATGRHATLVPCDSWQAISRLRRLDEISARNCAFQIPILVIVGAFIMLTAMLSEAALRFGRLKKLGGPLRHAVLVAFALPTAMLLVDGLSWAGIAGYFGRLIAVLGAMVLAAWTISLCSRRRLTRLAVLMLVSSAIILSDVLTGARLMRWSVISCDPIMGFRYYGIGNEYMGILIGSALLAPVLMLRPRWSAKTGAPVLACWMIVLWYACVAFVIGYPRLGANVGGLITAVAAFGAAIMAMSGRRIGGRHLLGLFAIACAAVAAFAVADTTSSGSGGSHLGRAIELARIYGWDWLGSLIAGKLVMHLGILKLPQTYWPIVISIPLLVVYGKRVRTEMGIASEDVIFRVGMPASLVGMAAAFVFNDSGVVPAGFLLAALVLTTMYLRLSEGERAIHGA